jgi:DNA anti-recombination protein RmuC
MRRKRAGVSTGESRIQDLEEISHDIKELVNGIRYSFDVRSQESYDARVEQLKKMVHELIDATYQAMNLRV